MRSSFSLPGLWKHKDFRKFWTGETISAFGSQVTAFALPITAAITLKATALQMGTLSFFAFIPMLVLSLFAGVIVDRLPRRPILIITSLAQTIVLGVIPLAALFHLLRLEWLYIIAFISGSLTVFFEIAYQAYLPSLVEQEHLLEGNGKLETSHSLAQIVGPGLAVWIVQQVTAPLAMLIDACSFLIAACFLCWIRKAEPAKEPSKQGQKIWKEISEGLKIVLHHRLLRLIAYYNGTINLFSSATMSIAILYIVRDLNIKLSIYGFILAIGSLGALLGSLLAKPLANRFGVGPTIVGAIILYGTGSLFLPLAGIVRILTLLFLVLSWFLQGLALMVFNITQVSLRQRLIPQQFQGRLNASMRFLVCSMLPIGSLIGGLLGETIGLFPTITLASIGMCFAFCISLLFCRNNNFCHNSPNE
jgi:MFS family permease